MLKLWTSLTFQLYIFPKESIYNSFINGLPVIDDLLTYAEDMKIIIPTEEN